ncbi:MAG: NAD(P)H-hydrate dehydratase [Ruminococcaceae bacterium]|nr:NAD(P)H-hydrate dehydratase [Oscillospiraceae bacterium]
MKLVTSAQMKELEALAMETFAIDSLLLMENAARSFCDALEKQTESVSGKTVAVFCGPGNNGGDGFAIARHLHNRGAKVTIVALSPERLGKDAGKNRDIAVRMGLPVLSCADLTGQRFSICVDALFGTGFHGAVQGEACDMIAYMNEKSDFTASVDMPSGASADDGSVAESVVRADLTVTFGLAKIGQFLYPAKGCVGHLLVAEISLPREIVTQFPANLFGLDAGLSACLPGRPENSHKGRFGKVLVLGGSPDMAGAPAMAAEAVLKCGAGMVTAAVPKGVRETVAGFCREMMTVSLPVDGEQLSKTAAELVLTKLKGQDVLVAGCGLGTAEGTKKAFLSVVSACDKPIVIDADGINLLKGNINIIKNKTSPVVLTPHPAEFSRISGHSMDYLQANKLTAAKEFAAAYGVFLVLKGADTVVAHPDGKLFVCTQSNSGLATAGSGDVLSGVIASMLAQGASAGDAVNLGVYLHSRAGLLARDRVGAYGMTAADVLRFLPAAVESLSKTGVCQKGLDS